MAAVTTEAAAAAIRAITLRPMSGAALGCRGFVLDGRLHATVVVKASFTPGADGAPRPTAPSLDPAVDLALYVPRPEVAVVTAPDPTPARLVVSRAGRSLVDRTAALGALGPVRPELRRMLLGSVAPAVVEAAVPVLPPGFSWAYYQRAPSQQGVDEIHGDETVRVEMGTRAVEASLPSIRAQARLFGPAGALRQGQPLALRADTLWLDLRGPTLSITWRVSFPIGAEPAGLVIVAAVIPASGVVEWPDPFAGPAPAPAVAAAAVRTAAPAAPAAQLAGKPHRLDTGTLDAAPDALDEIARARRILAERERLGIEPGAAPRPTAPVKPAAPQPGKPRLDRTLDVAAPPPRPVTPFVAPVSPASPPGPTPAPPAPTPAPARARRANPLEGTMDLDAAGRDLAAAAPSTPFVRRVAPAPIPAVAPRAPAPSALRELSSPRVAPIPAAPTGPLPPPPARLDASPDATAEPTSLGAAFLAAIEASGLPLEPPSPRRGRRRRSAY